MNARELIAALGGVPKLVKLTGLTEGRIYQWQTGNYIQRINFLSWGAVAVPVHACR